MGLNRETMSQPPELDDFDIDLNASDQEDNFELPGKPHNDYNGSAAVSASSQQSRQKSQEDRDAVLRTELQNVKSVNKVIEGVIANLEKAKGNMSVSGSTNHMLSFPFLIRIIRLSMIPFIPLQLCSALGPAFSHKRNIINV